jgi:hypothetical protein
MKGGETMRKMSRILITSLVLTVIMVISITGIAMAKGPYYGDCPSDGECPNAGDCPNPDCPNDGICIYDGEGPADGAGLQTQAQACQSTSTRNQYNNQSGAEGNCYANQHCKAIQNMYGVQSD